MVLLALVIGGGLAWSLVPWTPVPGGPLTPVRPDSVFTEAEVARAEAYAGTARLLGWSSLAVSVSLAAVLGFTPVGGRLVGRLRGPWGLRLLLATVGLLVAGRLATLPLALASFGHRRRYGLTRQPLAEYLGDLALALTVTVLVTGLLLLLVVGCARRWRRAWPAVAGALLAAVTLVASYGYPVLVEPLFNDFAPLPEGPLRNRITALAAAQGVDAGEVLVADASRRTTTLNAYVSGIGGSRRLVVYDTLVDALPDDQALSVVAHELAHARNHDVLLGSLLAAAGALVAGGALGLLLGAGGHRAGPRAPGDPRVVPLILALVAVGTLLASPVQNAISRRVELRADVSALGATGDGAAFEAVQRRLALASLADPTPPRWAHLWFGSHPTVLHRVALARRLGSEM